MHEHSGKNLSKIQQQSNLVDFGAGGITTTNIFGRPLHTPPPLSQDPSQFNFRNMNPSAPHGYQDLYAAQAHQQWVLNGGQGSQSFNNGYMQY